MIRVGGVDDLERVRAVQLASREAAQWEVSEYSFVVAEVEGFVAGFAVWRGVCDGEWELLNLAVDPAYRRRGLGRALVDALPSGRVFIEVRDSNAGARALYGACGFGEVGVRRGYYAGPREDGIVMERQT